MTKLTKLQTELLQDAAKSVDGFALISARAETAAAGLIKAGLAMQTPDGPDAKLMITHKGREAVSGPAPTVDVGTSAGGKLNVLIGLLKREAGATIEDMAGATGWQAHSVRGALSGSLKKAKGLAVESEKTEAGRVYRIVEVRA